MMNTMSSLEGKSALITGAASGIGRAVAVRFAAQGAFLALADKSAAVDDLAAEICRTGGRAVALQLEVTDEASVESTVRRTVESFGTLDVLVHSAGVGIEKPFLETSLADWQRVIDIDLTGTFLCAKASAKVMAEHRYGRIVTIASTAGIRGGFRRAAYGAAKGGVISLTKVMAVELGPLGITVNSLAPGAIETEMVAKMHSPETRRVYTNGIPMYRYGTPDETAAAAAFLASDDAAYINGHVLSVDGGFLAAGLMDPSEQAGKAGRELL